MDHEKLDTLETHKDIEGCFLDFYLLLYFYSYLSLSLSLKIQYSLDKISVSISISCRENFGNEIGIPQFENSLFQFYLSVIQFPRSIDTISK